MVAARTKGDSSPAQGDLPRGAKHVRGLLPGTIYETAAEIEAMGGAALPVPCDVTSEAEVRNMLALALKEFGEVDILVNNAGIYPRSSYLDATKEDFDTVFGVNVTGCYLACKHVLPHMIERRRGSIINLTSASSNIAAGSYKNTLMGRDLLVYASSKATVDRVTTFIADEVSEYGIAVNALIPGLVRTA